MRFTYPPHRRSLAWGIVVWESPNDRNERHLLSQEEKDVLRKFVLMGTLALVGAVPAQAAEGKELRISGPVVRASAQAVSVENLVGDAVLTCAVPARLAEKAAALKPGDKIRMVCVRHKGRKAELVKIQRLGEKAEEKREEKTPEEKRPEKQEAAGPIVELGDAVIVVQSSTGRLACRVPAEKLAKLTGLKLGDKVKILCAANVLAGLERYSAAEKPAGEEVRLYGKIAELSRGSVTVRGEAGSLTCTVPAALAEKVALRFAVGDSVKMMCRGSELTYLEKT